MKTAVVRMDFPTTAVNLGDNIHFFGFRWVKMKFF